MNNKEVGLLFWTESAFSLWKQCNWRVPACGEDIKNGIFNDVEAINGKRRFKLELTLRSNGLKVQKLKSNAKKRKRH